MRKFYFMDGTEDVVNTWINNCPYSFPIIVCFIILMCGIIGD